MQVSGVSRALRGVQIQSSWTWLTTTETAASGSVPAGQRVVRLTSKGSEAASASLIHLMQYADYYLT